MHKSLFLFSLQPKLVESAISLQPDSIFVGHKNLDTTQIERLHQNQIKVYAEVGIFAGEDLWEEFPDCRPVDRDGTPINKQEWYAAVNPTHPGVREKKLDEIRHTLNNLDVDGIWLDFIRWPIHWEVPKPHLTEVGFNDYTQKKFEEDTGLPSDVIPSDSRGISPCMESCGALLFTFNLYF